MTHIEKFRQAFAPLYSNVARWPAFEYLASELFALDRPVCIVSTGAIRNPANYDGDGCAQLLFDWVARETRGVHLAYDLDPRACDTTARLCSSTRTVCSDSIVGLRYYLGPKIDLLYLDSFDYEPGREVMAMMHQASELGAIYPHLAPNALIASDDCHSKSSGKHVGTSVLLSTLGITPLREGYINVWRF